MNERIEVLREKTSKLTALPGIYRMRNQSGEIIYIGKAKNLKNRVAGYFRENAEHMPNIERMLRRVYDYDFIVTDSEYEALVLECSHIKQHKPKYNILLKDDRGYHYVKISGGEYPVITAEVKNDGGGTFLGPFTSSFAVKQTVNEVNRVFMLPTCRKKFPQDIKKERPCLNYHIKSCMGVCSGSVSPEEYRRAVEQAEEYIRHGSQSSIESLTIAMEKAAEALDFERAARIRDRIAAIKRSTGEQKMVSQEIRDTDVIALSQNGSEACVAVIMYRGGRLFDRGEYFLGALDTPEKMLGDFIAQYYTESGDIPREIITEEDLPDREFLEKLLRERKGKAVSLDTKKRGAGLKLIQLAKSNASEYLALRVGGKGKEIAALEELGKLLGLPAPPVYIEAYDISNLSSEAMAAGMVVFQNGRPYKKAYKRFSIKTVKEQNDVACMREVLERRFSHTDDGDEGFSRIPDLILLDGGKAQVNAVSAALRELNITMPLFGMVKDSKHKTRAITSGGREISITGSKAAFSLVTKIQEEVHRFSLAYMQSRHKKRAYAFEITKIKGIGEKKALKLFTAFKTREEFKKASPEEIAKTAGVNAEVAARVYEFAQNEL